MKSQSVTGRHVLILFLLKWRRQSQFSRRQPLSVNVSVNDYRCFLLPWTNNTCNVGTVSRLWSLIHKDENTHLCSARVNLLSPLFHFLQKNISSSSLSTSSNDQLQSFRPNSSNLVFPDDCCCLLGWILMAPRWDDKWGELLGEDRGEIRGEDLDVASGGWVWAAEGWLIVGCFLGMRLRRWLTQRCCSSWLLVSKSRSLAVDMS